MHDYLIFHVPADARFSAQLCQALADRGWQAAAHALSAPPRLDDLRRELPRARVAVALLSDPFLAYGWQDGVLDNLLALETPSGCPLAPVWHELQDIDVLPWSQALAARPAILTWDGVPKVADALSDLLLEPVSPTPPPGGWQSLANIPSGERLEHFKQIGRSGSPADVDLLMTCIDSGTDLSAVKLADFALGLIKNPDARAKLRGYLLHGSPAQRNYAALYFNRRGSVELLWQAVQAGLVDRQQAFAK